MRDVVDGSGILHGLTGADEFGHALGVETVKTSDGGFGNDDAGGIDAEVVSAVDEARQAIHNEVKAARGGNVEGHGPARAIKVTAPIIVGDHRAAILCVAANSHKRAAVVPGSDCRQ